MAQTQRVGKTATTVRNDGGVLSVTYHATEVVRKEAGKITLRTNGWFSATTRTRMNQAAEEYGLCYHVWQKDFKWYVSLPNGKEIPFDQNEVSFPEA